MAEKSLDPEKFFKTACIFEASLIVVAMVLGWFADINPFASLHFSEKALFYGLAGTLPLFALFVGMQGVNIESVQRIRRMLLQTLGPSMRNYGWADLFVLAAIAGISEEVLFRGLIQPWIEVAWGFSAGLVFSNIIFGMVHAVTPLYAVLATAVGIYLGLSLDYGGERNLLIPIIIHAAYDFLAFILIMKAYREGLSREEDEV